MTGGTVTARSPRFHCKHHNLLMTARSHEPGDRLCENQGRELRCRSNELNQHRTIVSSVLSFHPKTQFLHR